MPPANLATVETIRDRVIALIEGLTPSAPASTRFRRYRHEGNGDFRAWATVDPIAAFRRFQARDVGVDDVVVVSNMDYDHRELTLEIVIAYAQDNRSGARAALDRDDAMDADWHKIDYVVGIYGRANFSGSHDCTPLGLSKRIEREGSVDFLVLTGRFHYWRSSS